MPENPDLFQHLTPQMFDDERARFFKNHGDVPNDPKAITAVAGQGGWCQPGPSYCSLVPPVGSINDERVVITQYTRTTVYPDQRRESWRSMTKNSKGMHESLWTRVDHGGKEMTTYKACKTYQPPLPPPSPPSPPVPEPVPIRQIARAPHTNRSLHTPAASPRPLEHTTPHATRCHPPTQPYPFHQCYPAQNCYMRAVPPQHPGPPGQPSLHNLPQRSGKKRHTNAEPIQSRPPPVQVGGQPGENYPGSARVGCGGGLTDEPAGSSGGRHGG